MLLNATSSWVKLTTVAGSGAVVEKFGTPDRPVQLAYSPTVPTTNNGFVLYTNDIVYFRDSSPTDFIWFRAPNGDVPVAFTEVAVTDSGISGMFLLSTSSSVTQAIPTHDGLAGTEATIDFGTVSDSTLSTANGEVTLLKDVTLFESTVELALSRVSGSGSAFVWAESSFDGGNTWTAAPNTGQQVDVANNSEGLRMFSLTVQTGLPAGSMLRVKVTNVGGGTIELAPPTTTVSTGTPSGISAKTTMLYR